MHMDKIRSSFADQQLREGHPYYMYDAIRDIPGCLQECMRAGEIEKIQAFVDARRPQRVFVTGCGTPFNACLAVAYTIRSFLHLPAAAVDAMDLFREPYPGLDQDAMLIAISHSGGTPATCQALEMAQTAGARCVAITGFPESRLAKAADLTLIDPYQREIPYGKTRSYLSGAFQGMLVAACLAEPGARQTFLAKARQTVDCIRDQMDEWEAQVKAVAAAWAHTRDTYLLAGYGVQEANAEEIGLKMIEVLGEVACGYGLEEFCHGASAAFRKNVGVIVFQTEDQVLPRALQIARSTAVSQATALVITNQPASVWPEKTAVITIPDEISDPYWSLFPAGIIGQLLFYAISVERGHNPDVNGKDRNPELVEAFDLIYAPALK